MLDTYDVTVCMCENVFKNDFNPTEHCCGKKGCGLMVTKKSQGCCAAKDAGFAEYDSLTTRVIV